VLGDEPERLAVVARRVVLFLACQVERHDAALAVRHGELRQLVRTLRADVAHAADDDPRRHAKVALGALQPGQHRVQDVGQGEAVLLVQDGRVAHLHVAHALGRAVLGQLVGDAFERLGLLQHGQRDVEDLEVVAEAPHARAGDELAGQLGGRLGGHLHALRLGELPHRARAQRAVEMEVKVGLGESLQHLGLDRHSFLSAATSR
jgi:hypothetical protein